ncbi:hypothetical protein V2J09_001352 [Rumex salicifolius]
MCKNPNEYGIISSPIQSMHINGPEANASAEASQRIKDDKQVARCGVANGGERGRLEENRLVKDVLKVDLNGLDPQALHPQPPCQVIHWERFLHVRTLKVLLVENDDSTRHIVSALLRNCSYEVIAVSNGLQAWKILEDISIHIDIVLSEVVMPVLSGIALLSKIMNHKTRKTTPVISKLSLHIRINCYHSSSFSPVFVGGMTSSHDSMGIVFKCLSKGAIDFLVKPIRKNELKNLWQHVWRKCHSSSGSGSESGVQNQKSLRSRSGGEDSENDSGSREEYDNRSIDLLRHDGSDNGSGTQMLKAQNRCLLGNNVLILLIVIHSRSEGFASSWVPTSAKEITGQSENVATEQNLQRGTTGSQNLLEEELKNSLVEVTRNVKNHAAPVDLKNEGKIYDSADTQVGSEIRKGDWMKQTAELSGVINSNRDATSESKQPFCLSQTCKTKDEAEEKAKESPSLELTLKRAGDVDNLRSDTPLNQVSNDSSNNNDMGSTTYRSFTKPAEVIDTPSSKTTSSAVDCANPSVVQASEDCLESVTKNDKPNASPKRTVLGHPGGAGQEVQVQHHYHHYHHHHHHVHCLPQLKQLQKRDELSPKKMAPALECGSSSVVRSGIEVNVADCSRKGSGSGSSHGSNQNNGGSTAVDVEGTNMETDNWAAPEGDAGAGSGSGSGTGLDQDLSAQKEASMNKICHKRKERCFDKRIRYQSKKKPADDRPRMHVQIVHQVPENKSKAADT